MDELPGDVQGYVVAAVAGGAAVLAVTAFCCIYRAISKALKNEAFLIESSHGLEDAGPYRTIVVGPEPVAARRSSAGAGNKRDWMGFAKNLRKTNIVPLGLRGRGVSVPGEVLKKHMRQEEMVFADAAVPGALNA